MKYYKIGKLSKILGLQPQTIRKWYKQGKIEAIRTEGNRLLFPESVLFKFGGTHTQKINVGYCRVSSNKQKDDLERQVELVQLYLSCKNEEYQIIRDIGSGINYSKIGLLELLDMIELNRIGILVIANKDRLVRFGYELIEHLCTRKGIKIEIISDAKKNDERELVDDMISIVTVFSARINGRRSHIRKKLIEDLNALREEN